MIKYDEKERNVMLNDKVKEKIAEAIEQSGLSQIELARKLEVNQSSISHYKNGRKVPSLEVFIKLCQVLDLDANDILCLR